MKYQLSILQLTYEKQIAALKRRDEHMVSEGRGREPGEGNGMISTELAALRASNTLLEQQVIHVHVHY